MNAASSKFTKEYKSPQQSRFRMASFTDMVKNKSKPSSPTSSNQTLGVKSPTSKLKPRYSYLSSTINKPASNFVKQQEPILNKKTSNSSNKQPLKYSAGLKSISARKANSTQKERFQSHKITTGINRRDNGTTSSFLSRDRLFAHRKPSNNPTLANTVKRPTTSTSNKHNLVNNLSSPKKGDASNRVGNDSKKLSMGSTVKNNMKKQKSSDYGYGQTKRTLKTQTPNVMKRKAGLLGSRNEQPLKNGEVDTNEQSYTTSRLGSAKRKHKFTNDESESSTTSLISKSVKGRSTVTPSRYALKSR